jgi:phosphatidylglycerophosphatase A
MRPASGTWGSLPPVVLAAGLWVLGCSPAGSMQQSVIYHACFVVVALVFGVACVKHGLAAEEKFGHDPKEVVADETCAQCIPLLALPATCFQSALTTCVTLAAAFVLFRVLDIIKPWPAHGLQRVKGGWGILLDDLFAALYAAILMQLGTRVLWPLL